MSEPPASKAPPPNAPSRGQVFGRRLLSTLGLWAIVVGAFCFAHIGVFLALSLLLVGLGLLEFFHMLPAGPGGERRKLAQTTAPVLLVSLLYTAALFGEQTISAQLGGALTATAAALLFLILVLMRLGEPVQGERTFREMATGLYGFLYIGVLFGFVVRIVTLPELNPDGEFRAHFYVLYLVAVTKFTDMGAYLVGSLIGRHKMIPHISPGKTWEGIAGAYGFALLASWGATALLGDRLAAIDGAAVFWLPLILATLAILGDLAESILKRSLSVKDSGQVMPGIGGVLDLIDSILFTAPALYLYLFIQSS